MKNLVKELLGFDVNVVGVAETLTEAVDACGSEENATNKINQQELAHSHYTKMRKLICTTLAGATGVEMNDGEKESQYIARLEDDLGKEALASHGAAILEATEAVPVDYTTKPRGVGTGGAPAKKWLAGVQELIDEGKFDGFCAKFDIDQDSFEDEDSLHAAAAHALKKAINAAQAALMASM